LEQTEVYKHLSPWHDKRLRRLSPEELEQRCIEKFEALCVALNVSRERVLGPQRHETIVQKRQLIAYVLSEIGFSAVLIAKTMRRHHTSICFAVARFKTIRLKGPNASAWLSVLDRCDRAA
jgi:chromosomal replication initiation ATPase DnaA